MRIRFFARTGSALRAAHLEHSDAPHDRSTHRRLAAAAAATTAVLLAPSPARADVAPAPSMPLSGITLDATKPAEHPSPIAYAGEWASLEHGPPAAALRAAETLVALAGDADSHASLIASGAVSALSASVSRALREPGEASLPLLANALRALADIARTHPSAAAFASADVAGKLAETLRKFPVARPDPLPWGEWLARVATFGYWAPAASTPETSPPPPMIDDEELSPVIDFTMAALKEVDLRPGIAYHAARCLANLARDTGTHNALREAGALDVAAAALKNSSTRQLEAAVASDPQLLDTLRCVTLCVAGLSKTFPTSIVASGAHSRLLDFMSSSADAVTQAYAAGGVRNLVRRPSNTSEPDAWRVQRDVVVAGAPDALAKALSADNAQAQAFAVLALGDLLTTGHHKAHLIHQRLQPAFGPFASLLASAVTPLSHASLRVAHAVYSHDTIAPGLSSAIAPRVGQLVQGPLKRGEVPAMLALASMASDAELASSLAAAGAVEALAESVRRGRGAYFDEASRALAALAAHPSLALPLHESGALAAVLKRPCGAHGGRYTAEMLANLARDEAMRPRIAHAGLPTLLRAAYASDADARRAAARAIYNLTLSGVSRIMVAQGDALPSLVRLARSDDAASSVAAVGALAGVAESYEHATAFVESDGVSALLEASASHPGARADAARALAHLAVAEPVHGSLAAGKGVEWLAETVENNGGRGERRQDCLYFAAVAVCNLAYSDGLPRKRLREAGVVPALAALAGAGMGAPDVAHAARQAVANLRGESPAMVAVDVASRTFLPA